jgi:hypothetical protein
MDQLSVSSGLSDDEKIAAYKYGVATLSLNKYFLSVKGSKISDALKRDISDHYIAYVKEIDIINQDFGTCFAVPILEAR